MTRAYTPTLWQAVGVCKISPDLTLARSVKDVAGDARDDPAAADPTGRPIPREGLMPARFRLLIALLPVVFLSTGCAGCVGTGGQLIPLAPDPPTPVSIKIYNSDIHLINDSEEDLQGLTVSIISALTGRTLSRTVGTLERKGYRLLPSYETQWLLVEGEVLSVAADGHSPTKYTVHLRARGGR